MYDDQEDQKVIDPDADLPRYRIRHNDMKLQTLKLIVRKSTQLIREQKKKAEGFMEKNVCMALVQHMKSDKANFGGGQGQWQCIIGKNLSAILNYDLHMLTFYDLPEFGLTVLVFKSG